MNGKVVVVTGSAGSGAGGSGKAIAKKFAENGAAVVIVDINKEAGEATEKEFIEKGFKAKFIQCDISNEGQVKYTIDTAVSVFGRIDVLVNCAFVNSGDNVVGEIPAESFDRIININLRGHFLMCKYAIPCLLKNEGANIVNISSIASAVGETGSCAYGAAKAGLVSLTRNIATQYGRAGLRCNAILPGLILSEQTEKAVPPEVTALFDVLDKQILLNRHGKGEDVANAAYFLASDEASFITGTTLNVDGGILAHNPVWADESALYKKG